MLGIAFYSLLANLTRNIKIAGHFYGLRDAGHLMKMRDCPAENGTGGNPSFDRAKCLRKVRNIYNKFEPNFGPCWSMITTSVSIVGKP
jgi:hypothetical protein